MTCKRPSRCDSEDLGQQVTSDDLTLRGGLRLGRLPAEQNPADGFVWARGAGPALVLRVRVELSSLTHCVCLYVRACVLSHEELVTIILVDADKNTA